MRISDWSSDVCSSDLHAAAAGRWSLVAVLDPDYPLPSTVAADDGDTPLPDRAPLALLRDALREGRFDGHERLLPLLSPREMRGLALDEDRKRGVQGKRVPVSVHGEGSSRIQITNNTSTHGIKYKQ